VEIGESLGKSLFAVFFLFCLVIVLIPLSLGASSLEAPSITLPAGWSLDSQMAYPTGGGAIHDLQGYGWAAYRSSWYKLPDTMNPLHYYTIQDWMYIWYEDAMGASYSDIQLQSEAETIAPTHERYYYTEFFSPPAIESGITTYAGVPAGFVKYYNASVNLYAIQLALVKNGYYINIYTWYAQGNETVTNSILNSLSVPEITPSTTPSLSPTPSQETSNLTTSVWVPPLQNAVGAMVVSVAAVGAAFLVFAAAGVGVAASGATIAVAATGSMGKIINKIRKLLPDTIKKWLEALVASKRKLSVIEKTGSPFVPTKPEGLAYIISILFLAFSFSYVKATDLSQILVVLPTIFATSILVAFVKSFFSIVYSRQRGVWTEHKLWYFGLATFIVTTFAFRVPFSSPTRNVHYGPKFTKRMGAILSSATILISLAFAGFFGVLLFGGFTVIGSTGLAMCIIGALFDTFPIEPLSGKNIFNHNKILWVGLFTVTLALYASWLLFMQ
jgi:hypothetical protein